MAVEIVEEDICKDSPGKIESDGGDGRREGEGPNVEGDDKEGEMSWNSSFSSALKLSPSGIDVSGSDDLLWNEIDLAERYLVSAMNEDAASTATTVLQTVSSLMHSTCSGSVDDRDENEEDVEGVVEIGKSEHEEMLECAGMVLLQSYRASGRVGEFFEILVKLNLGVADWPLILLETGACLQISEGAFPAARTALEEFLAVQGSYLPEEKFAGIVELFVIKVLVNGLREIEFAMNWVERANLTEETRLVILKKIQVQVEQINTTEPVSKPPSPPQFAESATIASVVDSGPTVVSFESNCVEEYMDTRESKELGWEADTCPGDVESSVRSKSLNLLRRLKVSEGFFSLKTFLELALARLGAATSGAHSLSAVNLEVRALRLGALVALSLFLLLRHRHSFRRLVGQSFSALRVGLSDLWKLAFSVHINPLAAAAY